MKTNPTRSNQIELIRNGHEFIHSNIELISSAKKFILLHTYIFDEDDTTRSVTDALIQAAERGVKVFILLDAVGSQDFPQSRIDEFKRHHIQFAFFTPLFNFYNIGRRLHQKVLIQDNEKALVGGINLARRFNNPDEANPWLDYSCLITGEEVHNIYLKVLKHYLKEFPKQRDELLQFRNYHFCCDGNVLIKTCENDWIFRYNEINKSYLTAINTASDHIHILATYFLPGKALLKALKKASLRGVKVTLIFGATSDHKIVQTCEHYFFNWYLEQGFEVYLWDTSILHGKLAIVDSKWSTIGSYNHNYLSKYGNSELNCEIINQEFNQLVECEFQNIIAKSRKISEVDSPGGVLPFLTYILLNLLTLLSLVFLYRQSDEVQDNIVR